MNKPKRRGYLEFMPAEFTVLDEKVVNEKTGDAELKVQVKWQHWGKINNNKRRYRRELLEREVGRLMPEMEKGKVTGAAYHPKDGIGETSDISHIWEEASIVDDGTCLGVARVIPTSSGKNLQTLIKSGVGIGVSSRGFGTVTEKVEKIEGKEVKFFDVNDDYQLRSLGDFVMSPSVPDAGIRRILEEQLNKLASSENISNEEIAMKFEKLEQLKEEYPELVKQAEDAVTKAVAEAKDAEIKKLKSEKAELETALVEKQKEVDGLKEQNDKLIAHIRNGMVADSEIEGVVPEEDPNANPNEGETETEKLKRELTVANVKVQELEEAKKVKEDAEKKATEEAKLQKDLKAEVGKVFEKEEYKVYKALIEKKIVSEDGKIDIETVEKVETTIKTLNDEISTLAVEAEKAKVLAAGTGGIGTIEDPEGIKKPSEDVHKNQYDEAVDAGFLGTFEEWKKIALKE